jgi:CheY-like chemotaxis protein
MTAFTPQALVIDSSAVARLVTVRALGEGVQVLQAATPEEALAALTPEVQLIVTALSLPRMSGQALAARIRTYPGHLSTPILVVSGNARETLVDQTMGRDITDHFDKSAGMAALRAFFLSYLTPDAPLGGRVLHVEDSRSIAAITARQLQKRGLDILQAVSAEDAMAMIQSQMVQSDKPKIDLVLCDHFLKGEKTGLDLVKEVRALPHAVSHLPILVTTGEENPAVLHSILAAGADDLLAKPMREPPLVAKIRYHLWRYQQNLPAPETIPVAAAPA